MWTVGLCDSHVDTRTGGTLYHLIVDRDERLFDEHDVLWYFYQIVTACAYIHKRHILHRCVSTTNKSGQTHFL
jgi:serine/threonine protein kinase